jgi:GAF domain-containing protein
MSDPARPIFQAIVDQAIGSTAAASGWLLLRTSRHDLLTVAAIGPQPAPPVGVGQAIALSGARAYALSSGQAAALMPQPGDQTNLGAGGHLGVPVSLLTVPCPRWAGTSWHHGVTVGDGAARPGPSSSGDDYDLVGVLEVAAKKGSRPFTVDDLAAVARLAALVGAALAEVLPDAPTPPSPEALAADLARLAAVDRQRYAATAGLIQAVLSSPP